MSGTCIQCMREMDQMHVTCVFGPELEHTSGRHVWPTPSPPHFCDILVLSTRTPSSGKSRGACSASPMFPVLVRQTLIAVPALPQRRPSSTLASPSPRFCGAPSWSSSHLPLPKCGDRPRLAQHDHPVRDNLPLSHPRLTSPRHMPASPSLDELLA